jgi:hypothetical protein
MMFVYYSAPMILVLRHICRRRRRR